MDGYGQQGRLNDLSVQIPVSLTKTDESFSPDNIIVFPNPAKHQVQVHLNKAGENEITEICLFAADGKEVWHQGEVASRQAQIDVSNMTNGIYFMHLITKEGTAVKKIQVLH